jgi:hypothetical protein
MIDKFFCRFYAKVSAKFKMFYELKLIMEKIITIGETKKGNNQIPI